MINGWSPVNSPHKGQWRGTLMLSFICAWTNRWVHIRDAGDLRRHRVHCDVTVMLIWCWGQKIPWLLGRNHSCWCLGSLRRQVIRSQCINSLWPSDDIWRQRYGSTLAQVMACCLTAPSHYLNQWWLIISEVQWHSSEDNFTSDTSATNY